MKLKKYCRYIILLGVYMLGSYCLLQGMHRFFAIEYVSLTAVSQQVALMSWLLTLLLIHLKNRNAKKTTNR